ncbi:hypothetical protein SAMN04487972_10654 [Paracoccus halophilus]|uniref:Uncharacterized protein n=1 Tax=Paracoccus halophilus TaxID=376733 RepID=A0A099F4J0_9RHOB|nr:hypothetical protein [Paracoccus halophilus]KGJ05349.1 hypothetical protein IT41_06125 [Paracoccus halophilus]SFA48804.1 hypothetical protein SAMN04487972_10654 [Paracoccus halophilus]
MLLRRDNVERLKQKPAIRLGRLGAFADGGKKIRENDRFVAVNVAEYPIHDAAAVPDAEKTPAAAASSDCTLSLAFLTETNPEIRLLRARPI